MADQISGCAAIHACPLHRVRTVLDALHKHNLISEDIAHGNVLNVGQPYSSYDVDCGSAIELAQELSSAAPDVAFTVYEEPADDCLGTTCSYVPELGLFAQDCDADGDPMFSRSELLQLDGEPAEVRHTKLGIPWLTAIAALPKQVVVEPQRFATHWNRRHAEVVIVGGKLGGGDVICSEVANAEDVDAALAGLGFQRADAWTQLDETDQLRRTDAFRSTTT